MEYKKYAIFFWIVLIVAGTTACGGKDTVSKKDRIKDIEVYDDNNAIFMSMIIIPYGRWPAPESIR